MKVDIQETVPVKLSRIVTEQGEDGCLVIAYPRFPRRWMSKLFPKSLSEYIHVPLEQFGSAVWSEIDGRRTTGEIAEALAQRFPEEADMKARAVTFIQQLHRDKFILLRYS